MRIQESDYYIEHKRQFQENNIDNNIVDKVINFAYEMSFGEGYHRQYRSGGQYKRKPGEIFCNTFQGKLAEYVFQHYLKEHGVNDLTDIDDEVMGQGRWDDTDLKANGYMINIKSAAHFSNLLLLETKDWNQEGQYIPNLHNNNTSNYDFFTLIRIKPDIKKLFKKQRWFYSNSLLYQDVANYIHGETWQYDIPGYITREDFIQAIGNNKIIPQNANLNGNIKMDSENYYFEAGEMRSMTNFLHEIQSI